MNCSVLVRCKNNSKFNRFKDYLYVVKHVFLKISHFYLKIKYNETGHISYNDEFEYFATCVYNPVNCE